MFVNLSLKEIRHIWKIYGFSIFCTENHLGRNSDQYDKNLNKDHARTIQTKFGAY